MDGIKTKLITEERVRADNLVIAFNYISQFTAAASAIEDAVSQIKTATEDIALAHAAAINGGEDGLMGILPAHQMAVDHIQEEAEKAGSRLVQVYQGVSTLFLAMAKGNIDLVIQEKNTAISAIHETKEGVIGAIDRAKDLAINAIHAARETALNMIRNARPERSPFNDPCRDPNYDGPC